MSQKSHPSTYSLAARDPQNGDFGIVVQSKFPAVGVMVPWAKADIGAVATQAWANTSYGPRGLELLRKGKSVSETLRILLSDDDNAEHRQVGIVDAKGNAIAHTGDECMEWAGHLTGNGFTCQGNILTGEAVIVSMVEAYEQTEGDLIDKLFASLKAGQAAGGDRRGMQSAAILVVREKGGYEGGTDRYVDVRVDDHQDPIKELERVFGVYDMTLLSREDPSRLLPIEGDIALKIQQALQAHGFLEEIVECQFPNSAVAALREWTNINNFENKWRDDGKIWKSVFDYLVGNQ